MIGKFRKGQHLAYRERRCCHFFGFLGLKWLECVLMFCYN